MGERMMLIASTALASTAGGGFEVAVSVGASDCGGFAWTLGSVGASAA